MSGFVLHPEALQDLEEIWEFIAADNVAAADRVLEQSDSRAYPLPERWPQTPRPHFTAPALSAGARFCDRLCTG
jgi:hypothetical protein